MKKILEKIKKDLENIPLKKDTSLTNKQVIIETTKDLNDFSYDESYINNF